MHYFRSTFTQFDNINFSEIMLSQDMAIRQFCPERIDQEYSEWNDGLFNIEAWFSSFDSNTLPCSLTIDEDSNFIDSIINTSLCEEVVATSDEVGSYSEDSSMITEESSVDKGLELVHLLLACAEAVGCRDTSLASLTLSQIWPLANPNGDSLQRVSFCFALGLKSRLSLLQNVGTSGSLNAATIIKEDNPIISKQEKMDAFNYLYQATPYIAFGFMAANNAIIRAAKGKDYLHIVDLGMSHVLQWSTFIQMLTSRPEGPPPRVRITGISPPGSNISELESNMKFLINEASLIGVHIEFRAITELASSPSLLTAGNLDLRQGETLFVNSIMHLHRYVKESRGSLKAVLVAIRKLKPTLLTVAEQDANHNGPFFLARFLESLHYYSAVFDSLEASLPRSSLERTKIERSHFGEDIWNIISCEGGERVERHERADQWRRQLGRAGFQSVGFELVREAKMLASAYGCEGYTVGSEKGCLLLGWKGRHIMWASAWQVNAAAASSSSS